MSGWDYQNNQTHDVEISPAQDTQFSFTSLHDLRDQTKTK